MSVRLAGGDCQAESGADQMLTMHEPSRSHIAVGGRNFLISHEWTIRPGQGYRSLGYRTNEQAEHRAMLRQEVGV
jgi:hypothetical protein